MVAKRNKFSNKFGFIAAAAGSAVGLGNIWKFPFEVGRGGGAAFILVYVLFCFVLCYPILLSEFAIGRRAQTNPIGAFRKIGFPKWGFVGIMGVFCGVVILSFYNVVAGWVFGYFVEMLVGNFDIGNKFSEYIVDIPLVGGYTLAFMFATAIIVSQGVTKGIEKASKILMPVLLVLILLMVAYAMTLEGAMAGIKFYLVPDFSKLSVEVIYRALGQAFFSLSLGLSALMTYGSYLGKNEDLVSSGAIVTLADVGIAFLAGLMIFPFVFSQGIETDGGPGLIFVTMPGIFANMGPVWGIVVGSTFFLLLTFAALTSTISLLELPVAYLVDQHKIKRKYAVWYSAGIIILLGVPSMLGNGFSPYFTEFITYIGADKPTDYMTFVSDLASNTLLPLGGFFISIFVIYKWGTKKLFKELSHGSKSFPSGWLAIYVKISLQYLAPVVLGIIFIITVLETFFGVRLFG